MSPPPVSSKPAAAAAVASAGAAKGRVPRGGPPGTSPKGKKHEGLEEELSAAEAAAASVMEDVIAAGAALLQKRTGDRQCFAFAAASATHTLLNILRLCHLTIDPGEPGDVPLSSPSGAPDEGEEGSLKGSEGGPLGRHREEGAPWDVPPMPIPGKQDSWAPGCLGIKPLTPELIQELEAADRKRETLNARRKALIRKHPKTQTPPATATGMPAAAAAAAGAGAAAHRGGTAGETRRQRGESTNRETKGPPSPQLRRISWNGGGPSLKKI